MGLLDAFNSPEMGLAMGLLNAGGASSRPVSLGQGIAQGYQGFQQAQENNQQRAAREQQMQMHTLQMKQMQDAQKLSEDRKVQLVSYLKELQATNPAEAAKYQQAVSLGIPLDKVWEHANKDPKFAYHEGGVFNESKLTPTGMPTQVGTIPQQPAKQPWEYATGSDGKLALRPEVLAGKVAVAAAGRPVTNINTPYEPQFAKTMAELDGKTLDKYRTDAVASRGLLSTLGRMEKLNPKVYEAGGADAKLGAANFLAGIGVNVDAEKLANSQEFDALATKAVMDSLGGSLGVGVSNADVAFMKKTVPQLGHSMEARKQMITFMRDKANGKIQMWNDAQNYAFKNKGLKGFNPASGDSVLDAADAIINGKP